MRQLVKRLLTALAIVIAAVGADAAAMTMAAHAAGASTCLPSVNYQYVNTGTPQGGVTQWRRDCNDQQRVHLRCWDQLTNKEAPYDGGWVYSDLIESGQNCHLLGEILVRFGWQVRAGPGDPIEVTWIWIRPGFKPRS